MRLNGPIPKSPSREAGLTAFAAAAAVVIGRAIELGDGRYDNIGIRWLGVGVVLAACAALLSVAIPRYVACIACLAALFWQVQELWHDSPLALVQVPSRYYTIALPILALSTAGAIFMRRFSWSIFLPLLLTAHFITGVYLLHLSPKPFIDVYEVTRDSCVALSHGQNPYAIEVPDIYANDPNLEKAFYPPDFVSHGRILFGYQYMPLSLVIAYVGHAITGDFRLGNLLAFTAAAGFLAYARRGFFPAAAASLLLLTPRGYFVIQQGWSEPVVVLCLCAVTFFACRRSRWLPFAVGLLLVSKQHMILCLPAILLLLPRPWEVKSAAQFIGKACLAGAIATLPLALWNLPAFWHSAVVALSKNPFRYDSLNLAATWARLGGLPPPTWIAFAFAFFAAIFALWRAPRSPAGFAAAIALIYLCLFALAKQAFCNYYFFTIGALCCSVAAFQDMSPALGSDSIDMSSSCSP